MDTDKSEMSGEPNAGMVLPSPEDEKATTDAVRTLPRSLGITAMGDIGQPRGLTPSQAKRAERLYDVL